MSKGGEWGGGKGNQQNPNHKGGDTKKKRKAKMVWFEFPAGARQGGSVEER